MAGFRQGNPLVKDVDFHTVEAQFHEAYRVVWIDVAAVGGNALSLAVEVLIK
ncbi:hypothetical protein [Rhizobium grahamii]|uniref:hypothetical protein n=1 Tax=Rhizobium grahamii TaxID=1120045 RepID=UPI0003109D6D|nr:hypothetical protein [Rhizobium grahamii]